MRAILYNACVHLPSAEATFTTYCSADFNCDGDIGTDLDIQAFFACLSGDCCASCGGSDFNGDGDGDTGTDADIEAFFRVLHASLDRNGSERREHPTMDADMRHFVVFRVPEEHWQSSSFNSSDLDDWIHNNTMEGKPCVLIGETDFRHHYVILGFTTAADRAAMIEHLRSFPFVEFGFSCVA